MFKIAKEPTFTRTVPICVPIDGGFEDQSLRVTFRVLPASDLGNAGDGAAGQVEDLKRIIVRMDDLVGEDGKTPVEYNEALRDQLIDVSYVRLALLKAYIDAITKVKTGN